MIRNGLQCLWHNNKGIYDGIQRPLEKIVEKVGANITRGVEVPALDREKKWAFTPAVQPGTRVVGGDVLGTVQETESILHKIMVPPRLQGTVVSIEGGSASGKTTLGELLQNVYGCPVFHMDDFFLRPEQRTEARFTQPGGNVDRERFLEEVLIPLREGRPVDYRRFDCATFTIAPPQRIKAGTLNIVEGAYSMHPDLAPYYDLSVFLPISAEKQRERILKRNAPAHAKQFFDRWIPFEQRYFDALDVRNRCALILSADD